jgi:hypothetical protein
MAWRHGAGSSAEKQCHAGVSMAQYGVKTCAMPAISGSAVAISGGYIAAAYEAIWLM